MMNSGPIRQMRRDSKLSPLSNWPRYPGGAIAGALIGVASVVVFLFGLPSIRFIIPAAVVLVVILRTLRSGD